MIKKQKSEYCWASDELDNLNNERRKVTEAAEQIVRKLSKEEKRRVQTVISLKQHSGDLFFTQLPYSIRDSIAGQNFCPGRPDVGHVLTEYLDEPLSDIEHLIQNRNVLVVARASDRGADVLTKKIIDIGGKVVNNIKL